MAHFPNFTPSIGGLAFCNLVIIGFGLGCSGHLMFLVQWQECLSRPYQKFRLCPEFALYLGFVSEAGWVFSLPSSMRNHPSPPPSSRTGLRYFASPSFFFLRCLSVSLSPSRRRNRRQYRPVGGSVKPPTLSLRLVDLWSQWVCSIVQVCFLFCLGCRVSVGTTTEIFLRVT